MWMNIATENKTAVAIIKGNPVPLNIMPTGIAIRTLITVEVEPMIDAAKPAMCPTGSIAKEFRLPKHMTLQKKKMLDHITKAGNSH